MVNSLKLPEIRISWKGRLQRPRQLRLNWTEQLRNSKGNMRNELSFLINGTSLKRMLLEGVDSLRKKLRNSVKFINKPLPSKLILKMRNKNSI